MQELKNDLQLTLSCVSRAVVVVNAGGYRRDDETHWIGPSENPISLRGRERLSLLIDLYYRLVPSTERNEWQTEIAR